MLPVIKVLATYFCFQESCRHRIVFKAWTSFPHDIASVHHAERREVTFSCSLKEYCCHFMKSSFLKVHTLRIICQIGRMDIGWHLKKKKCLVSFGIAEWPFCREVICAIYLSARSYTKFSRIIFLMALTEEKNSSPPENFFSWESLLHNKWLWSLFVVLWSSTADNVLDWTAAWYHLDLPHMSVCEEWTVL